MNKGISLISLVATIITLIILAATMFSTASDVLEQEMYLEEKVYCPTCGKRLGD